MRIITWIFWVALLAHVEVPGQEIHEHTSSWNSVILKKNFGSQMFLRSELNFRRTDFLRQWQQIIFRPSLQYRMDKNWVAGAGFSYIQNFSYAAFSKPRDTREFNLWQQAIFKYRVGKSFWKHRLRFEERFKENIQQTDGGQKLVPSGYEGRLRYRLYLEFPSYFEEDLSIMAFDELHLDFQQQILSQDIDQNRIFLGLRWRDISLSRKRKSANKINASHKRITIQSGCNYIMTLRENKTIRNYIWETKLIYTL